MKTVYAVNTGCYSDYRVVALFSTKEKAQAFMAAVPDRNYNDIEEFLLDPPTADLARRGYWQWDISMLRDGTVEYAAKADTVCSSHIVAPHRHWVWRRSQNTTQPDCLRSAVMAKDEKHAIKIASEHRVQLIATGQWD